MSSFNEVLLIGNLGKDPEILCPTARPAFAKVQIATHRKWKKDNQVYTKTDWHTVMLNGKLTELARLYLHKGDRVFVRGTLVTEKWTDKEDRPRISVHVQARQLCFLSPKATPKTETDSVMESSEEVLSEISDADAF